MKKEKLSKKEIEKLCVDQGIILERHDPVTNTSFYLPNLEKIGIMIREFEFLVEGAARGRAINEISKIERYMHEHNHDPKLQNEILATNYSKVSIFIESKRDLITDRNSENWKYIFTKYFTIEDIYDYFHKTESASTFFKNSRVFDEIVELSYNLKFMDYLQSQIELFIPVDEEKEIPYRIESSELSILILHKLGVLDAMKNKMKDHYYVNGAKFLASLLGRSTSSWKPINEILWSIDHEEEDSIINNSGLNDKLRDILYHYKIDLR